MLTHFLTVFFFFLCLNRSRVGKSQCYVCDSNLVATPGSSDPDLRPPLFQEEPSSRPGSEGFLNESGQLIESHPTEIFQLHQLCRWIKYYIVCHFTETGKIKKYRGIVFDEQLSPAESVFRGRNGQISEEPGDTLDGDATPVRPGHGRQHLVALQEAGVGLAEGVAAPPHLRRLQQPAISTCCCCCIIRQ